jgi:hypothetical protein
VGAHRRLAVVTMLQKAVGAAREIPPVARKLLWSAVAADVMTVAWMLSIGDWLDSASRVTAVVTLGGHHIVVLWLAVVAFVVLGATAIATGGFIMAVRWQEALLITAAIVSIVATSGVASVLALFGGAVLAVSLLGLALVRRR